MQVAKQIICQPAFRYCSQRLIQTTSILNMPIKVGDPLPSVDLMQGTPDKKVNTSSFPSKTIIFGVPGAFTPTCSKDHAPGFVKSVDAMKSKGVQKVVCMSVNDPFVMDAWGQTLDPKNKIDFLADTTGELTKALDLALDATPLLGNVRCKRFSMYVEDGKVKALSVEPDGTGLTCSRAEDVLKTI